MRELHFDIEAYSPVDLKKCGMYRYAEEAEVLLLAYAYDDEPVECVDLAQGEPLPLSLIADLTDPGVMKFAHNAQFERVLMRQCMGITIPTEQMRCTAVWAASLGLPRHLAQLTEVLKLGEEGKLSTGKALIRKFCVPRKPTKKNPATRVFPKDEPEKWAEFKAYNIADVKAERAVHRLVEKFPVPDKEWSLYALDQRINDYGIRVDLELVNNAIRLSQKRTDALMERAKEISGLENPNSRDQLLQWLDSEDVFTTTLTKKDVEQILGSTDNEKVRELMEIRQQISKASVKKYLAIARSVCRDGRLRGTTLFYGAGTGRWCLTGDHEVLTPTGWEPMATWEGGKIAVWNTAGQVYFSTAEALSFEADPDTEMIEVESARLSQAATREHAMPVIDRDSGSVLRKQMADLYGRRFLVPFTGLLSRTPSEDPDKVRVLVMVQADGHYTQGGHLRLHFKKRRKIERAKMLLRKAGLLFTTERYEDREVISVKRRHQPLWLRMFSDKTFGWWLLQEDASVVFDELEYWDAYRCGPNSVQYSTTNKQNAEVIQAMAHTSGRSAVVIQKQGAVESWSTFYVVNIWLTPGPYHEVRKEHQRVRRLGEHKVYCARTETGYFMVRRKGRVWVTGNSGQILQPQNMPSKGLLPTDDIATARGMLKHNEDWIEWAYSDVARVLSSLIRPSLIPGEEKHYCVADFSAIEGRVTAWLAHEEWRLELFAKGGKLYETSAERMFNLPAGSVKKGNPYRDKGKVAELALGYQGWVGALIQMGALDMGLTLEELAPLAQAWRDANPAIVAYWEACEKAALQAMQTGKRVPVRTEFQKNDFVHYAKEGKFLVCELPSGRKLYYAFAKVGRNDKGRLAVSYMGIDSTTKRWGKQWLYGGLMTENQAQAVARDCLAETMLGWEWFDEAPIVLHVHDELDMETPVENSDMWLERLLALMAKPIEWAPGLLLKGDGYITPYYVKED